MNAQLTKAIPTLPTQEIHQAISFFTQMLGFTLIDLFEDPHAPYALLSRQDVEIHLWTCHDRHVVGNCGCYLHARGIEDIYQEFIDKGVNILAPLKVKSYGMKEFAIADFDGNLLRIGEPDK